MADIHHSLASLRIWGDDLNPHELARLLGCEGTSMYSKGDVQIGKKTGHRVVCQCGLWRLEATECHPENINRQVEELLGKLTDDMTVWQQLASQYKMDLFCGLFMEAENEGMFLSSQTLIELGRRGIELSLDIYGPCEQV